MVEVSTVEIDLDFPSTLVLPWQFDFLVPGLFVERNCRFRGIGPMKQ